MTGVEEITSQTFELVLNQVLTVVTEKSPNFLVSEATKEWLSRNFDDVIREAKSLYDPMKLPDNTSAFAVDLSVSIATNLIASTVSKMIVEEFGQTGEWWQKGLGITTAASIEVGIISAGNFITSKGSVDFAISQAIMLGGISFDVYEEIGNARDATFQADVASLRADLSEAVNIAVQRLSRGENIDMIRDSFLNEIELISESIDAKSGLFRNGLPNIFRSSEFEEIALMMISDVKSHIIREIQIFEDFIREADLVAKQIENDLVEMQLDAVFDLIINNSENGQSNILPVNSGNGPALAPEDESLRADRNLEVVIGIIEGARPVGDNPATSSPVPARPVSPQPPVIAPPTGPTPEQIAEAERQAEIERQRLAAEREARVNGLIAERDAQFRLKLDAEGRITDNNNRLTILRFEERERIMQVYPTVVSEAERLRFVQRTSGLNDADAARFRNLVAYQEVLEGELDRIRIEENNLTNRNTEFSTALSSAEVILAQNRLALLRDGYDVDQLYQIPRVSVVIVDWSGYVYQLPAFGQTDVPATELRNAVVSSVSLPVTSGTIRNSGTLVSENGVETRFEIFGVTESQSEKLDDFNQLFIGRNSTGLRWIYGEASTPEQFALRTGTATFRGGLSGYYAHGTLASNTVYNDSVQGNLMLNVNFGTSMLSGEGTLGIENAARNEEISFQISPSSITESNDGLSRSLWFASNATLENGVTGNGNFSGAFYGTDASEAAGTFAFDLDGGFAAGLWATGENYVPRSESAISGAYVIGYSSRENGYGTAWDEAEKLGDSRLNYFNEDGDGSVDILSTLPAGGFSYISWGTWSANGTTREALGSTGYWVHADPVTSPAIVENRTGTAQYGGEIIGGYVSSGNIWQYAQGVITLTANFADQSIGGQFQFGRAICSGSGLSGCSIASEVQSFNEPMNDYDGAGFGNFERTGNSGVVGVFAGDNAQEIAGHAWLTESQGMYIGVFRAGEGLSFGQFVTPTGDQAESIGYLNYRGLLAYSGIENIRESFGGVITPVTGFVGVQSVSDTGEVVFDNSNLTRSAAHTSSDSSGTYNYVTWGEWDSRSAGSVFTIDGQDVDQGRGNWLVYDPTTDLPTSGSASYQGTVDGAGSGVAGGVVRGGIHLEADFGNDRITGSVSLRDGNNTPWADAAFDAPITRDADSSGFQGALTGANVGAGAIFGGFAGPNAEEVGGGWQINHVNGSDANGIFRAQQ